MDETPGFHRVHTQNRDDASFARRVLRHRAVDTFELAGFLSAVIGIGVLIAMAFGWLG